MDSLKELEHAISTVSQESTETDKEVLISIDVEAAAIGRTHSYSDRKPCWVAVVDSEGKELLNLVIQVPNMVSPLTKVTGLTREDIEKGVPLDEALKRVHSLLIGLGNNVTLVGQRIDGDISWMQLKKGVHYAKVVELSEEFRTYNERFNDYTYYSLAKEVYGVFGHLMHDDRNHNPLEDAQFSMKLYVECVSNPQKLKMAKNLLRQMSYRKEFPRVLMAGNQERNIDGCCGWGFDPKKCLCGAPTLRGT